MDNRIPYVHSFPRSGTHLLAATLKRNFYADVNVGTNRGGTGHWSARVKWDGAPYGKLFRPYSPHALDVELEEDRIHFYIYRDGRDVAVSLWNAKIMLNPEWRDWPFSKFLRTKLDWLWSPGKRDSHPRLTVAEQWMKHLDHWETGVTYFVQYEWLIEKPLLALADIARYIEWEGNGFQPVYDKVGVSPGAGKVGTWKSVFTVEDLAYFHSIVPTDHWGLWRNDVYS